MEIKNKSILSALIILVLAVIIINDDYTGKAFYRDYGYGGYGGYFPGFFDLSFFSFSSFYEEYWFIVDAIIFLLIFLELSKSVFKNHFKDAKGLYIGIGLFLTFSLILFEERSGFNLLFQFGPIVFVLFVIIMAFVAYKYLKEKDVTLSTTLAVIYLAVYFLILKTNWGLNALTYMLGMFGFNYSNLGFLDLVAALMAIILIIKGATNLPIFRRS